jgi:enoyl-CoA hydratase/carnithine racemase
MIQPVTVTVDEVITLAAQHRLADELGPLVIIEQGTIDVTKLGSEPTVVIGGDVVAHQDIDIEAITDTVDRAPVASTSAMVLLRAATSTSSVAARFAHESATYSALQSGPEFARWLDGYRAARQVSSAATAPAEPEAAVHVRRESDSLCITLNRPRHGNAINNALRDELCAALDIALSDPSIRSVQLNGNGPNFCTGGDLVTFGLFESPAAAHHTRLTRSIAQRCYALRERLTSYVHGRCLGSGVELAAFSATVVAHRETTFGLPELSLGLVPGAGGTISIVDRIGPERTAYLLLTGRAVGVDDALRWGLIDQVETTRST